jgi:tetratricopeptide (TPR) repeat protein
VQSKMYRMGVKCSDCHNVHSTKRLKEDNQLCLQCHRSQDYDTAGHHFHKKTVEGKPSDGALCVKCHMPETPFMVVDWRADHSIRNPRPDLTKEIDSPNACSSVGCHDDKSVEWSIEAMDKWYGLRRRPHYGTTFASAREQTPQALEGLIRIASDPLYSDVVRATAVSMLDHYPGDESTRALEAALADEKGLVRLTAIRTLNRMEHPGRANLVLPLLYDSLQAVRIEAASNLAGAKAIEELNTLERKMLQKQLALYKESMAYSSDFAFGRFNLGNLAMKTAAPEEARRQFERAIAVDPLFYPAKTNLAIILNGLGQNEKAETLLKEVQEHNPELYNVSYNLGLLLAEVGKYGEATIHLRHATKGMPQHSRAHYNLGLLLQAQGESLGAEKYLLQANTLAPEEPDYIFALLDHYVKRRSLQKARAASKRFLEIAPNHPNAHQVKLFLDQTE